MVNLVKSDKCGFMSVTFHIGIIDNSYTPLKLGYLQIDKLKRITDVPTCKEEIDILI